MIDLDNSFIRLRDNFQDAKNLDESPLSSLPIYGQVTLSKGESYLQISNSPTSISFNDNYEVHLVDCSGGVVEDITSNVFLTEFFDSNGIKQIAWEYVCNSEHYGTPLYFRFTNTVNLDTWWSNPVFVTEMNKHLTTRFDYKHYENHYGTQYERANYYQSIRLATYYRNPINEDTREEYHEITTDSTIAQRNIKKRKRNYILDRFDNWTAQRLDNLITCSCLYVDCVRMTSTTPIEFNEPELDSNFYDGEMVINPIWTDVFTFEYQIFEGLQFTNFSPIGDLVLCTNLTEISFSINLDTINLLTGTLTLFDSSDTIVQTFTQDDMVVSGNTVTIATDLDLSVDNYTFTISQGLFSSLGILNDSVSWSLNISLGDWLPTDFLSTDWLTGCANPIVDNLVLFYKFNETSGTTAIDDSTLSNNGTVVNTLINQAGLIDRCYAFNTDGSTDDYVSIADNDSLSFGSGAFSLEVWLNPNANFGRIINKYNATTGDLEYRLFVQTDVVQFFMYTDASNNIGIADNVQYTSSVWNQIIVTYDGTGAAGLKMKINNNTASFSPVETGSFVGMPNTTQDVYLGQQSDDLTGVNRYNGLMDILRVWKGYALTDLEITDLYNLGNGTETI
jgi:hypothetical protein